MKTLVIGAGEIGKSLFNVLDKEYECSIIDIGPKVKNDGYEIIHICFPYSKYFVEEVVKYQAMYNTKYTVIHSTVKPGTSEILGAIYSPCIGIHPHLEESMKIFTKFLGGKDASDVAQYFRRAGIKVYLTDDSTPLELTKSLSTTYYGMCIEYTKEVKRQLDGYGGNFELWTLWNNNYNNGYKELGYPEYVRQNLIPMMGVTGGHCILPNLDFISSPFAKFIKDQNE